MEENKRIEMRKLSGQDLFPMLKILSKVKVKDMVIDFLKKRDEVSKDKKKYTEEETKNLGIEVFAEIINTALVNLDYAKDDINKLLVSLTNMKLKEIEELGMFEYTALVMDFFNKEELTDFFKCIASSKMFQNSK